MDAHKDTQDRLELVERVREKSGVGYSDAKAALDACGDDLLDALVWLEEQGRSATRTARSSTGAPADGVSSERRAAQTAYARSAETGPQVVSGGISRLGAWVRRTWHRGLETRLVSRRGGPDFVTLPLLPTLVVEILWLMLAVVARYYVWGPFAPLAAGAPFAFFFYLVFGCRIERPEGDPRAASADEGEPTHG